MGVRMENEGSFSYSFIPSDNWDIILGLFNKMKNFELRFEIEIPLPKSLIWGKKSLPMFVLLPPQLS
jgi:hypothetical protein